MALPNLSGSNIQDTYQRVLHTDGATLFDGTGSTILTSTELNSLKTINSNEIANADWQYMSTLNQHVSISSDVQFRHITASGHISSSGTVFATEVSATDGITIAGNAIDYNAPNLRIKNTGLEIASGPLTASIVSASGNIFASQLHLPWMGDIIWDGDTNTRIETSGNPEDLDIYADRHIRLKADGNVDFGDGPKIRFDNPENLFNMNIQPTGVSILTTNISASGHIAATGSITASGEISASGNLIGSDLYLDQKLAVSENSDLLNIGEGSNWKTINIGRLGTLEPILLSGLITASGNISASMDIHGDTLVLGSGKITAQGDISMMGQTLSGITHFATTGNTTLGNAATDTHTITGHITASGNISSSGYSILTEREYPNCEVSGQFKGDIVEFGTGPGGVNGDIIQGELYTLDSSQHWEKTDADDIALTKGMLGIAVENDVPRFLIKGFARLAAYGFTTGDVLYVSETPGDLRPSLPSGANGIVRVVGYCVDGSGREIWFDPDKTFVKIS